MFIYAFLILICWAQRPSPSDKKRRSPVVVAVEKVAPSVVSITTEGETFLTLYGPESSSGDGSGVVIDTKGIVLTNAHVVESSTTITATFSDNRSFQAEIIGIAPELDLAVLKLQEAKNIQAVPIGKSSNLFLGETVIAIGNPFGLGHTVTTGVVSATNRALETEQRVYQNFIQTDASINPGNSGGPLLNINGELIGINTAIRADAEGIGFAIPVDRAMKVAQDLVNYGAVQIPWLGVDVTDIVYRYGRMRLIAPEISFVHAGSPGDRAGLKVGDLLLGINGKEINGRSDLNAYLSAFTAGKVVSLKLWRGQTETTLKVKTGTLPEKVVDTVLKKTLGIEVEDNAPFGVMISQLSRTGNAARERLQMGDLILGFNGSPVKSTAQFRSMLLQAKSEHRSSALFTIRRRRSQARIEIEF